MNQIPCKAAILFSLGLTYSTSFAQSEPIKAKANVLWEVYRDIIPAGSSIKVGIMRQEVEKLLIPTNFYIIIPEHSDSILCTSIVSSDGKYATNIENNISNIKGLIELSWPAKLIEKLISYSSKDIIILASYGSCETYNEESHLGLVSWNKKDISKTDSISIFLNSNSHASLQIKKSRTHVNELEFEKIDRGKIVKYDHQIKISANEIKQNPNIYIRVYPLFGPNITYPLNIKK